MIRYKEIAFVAYAVTRMARSRKFYEKILGLKPNKFSSGKTKTMWMEYDIGPGTLGIGVSDEFKPSLDGPCVALEVVNFAAAIAPSGSTGSNSSLGLRNSLAASRSCSATPTATSSACISASSRENNPRRTGSTSATKL